jgi:formylglycine-generating enzyme required for sulfatase activity
MLLRKSLAITVTFAALVWAGDARPAAKTREAAGMTFVRIEPGEFWMGSPPDEAGREKNEVRHKVRLTRPFHLQTTEVSQKVYAQVMGENPSHFKGDDLPVQNVSWDDAIRFCQKLSAREGKRFRLPTEAEWEYAARAGKDGPVSGTGKLDEMSWHADNLARRQLRQETARLGKTLGHGPRQLLHPPPR